MAGYSSASWAIGVLFSDCHTKDAPPPFTPPNTTFGYTPSPSGQGSDGTDGDALDAGGGPGDAPRPGVVPQRPVGRLPGVSDRTGASQALRWSCGIAGGESRPS